MSATAIAVAVIPENVVLLAAVGALYHLLRQGGGLQVKAPGTPRKVPQQPAAEPDDPKTVSEIAPKREAA